MPKIDWTFLQAHCDGSGPHGGPDEVRSYPLGGGANLILCRACWDHENAYRRGRARTGGRENWPEEDWNNAAIYATRGKAD